MKIQQSTNKENMILQNARLLIISNNENDYIEVNYP